MEQGTVSKAEDLGLTSWHSLSPKVVNACGFPEGKSTMLSESQEHVFTSQTVIFFMGLQVQGIRRY